MKKLFFILSFFAIILPIKTEENLNKQSDDVIKNLKIKLNKVIKTDRKIKASAVFGVRGNKYDSKNKLYWKNSTTEKTNEKIKKEKEELDNIINKIENGDKQSAKEDLKKFIDSNQQSQFINDAKKLLNSIEEKTRNEENIKESKKESN